MITSLSTCTSSAVRVCSCMMNLGQHHQSLVVAMTPDLLSLHPYFESIEPDIDDPACILAGVENIRSLDHYCLYYVTFWVLGVSCTINQSKHIS